MLRSLLIAPLLLALWPATRPLPQEPQTGRWVQAEVNDWLGGSFSNTYVEGSVLRLQAGQTTGEFTSSAFQATFGFNAAVLETVTQATTGQTLTLELRSSLDGTNWSEWQPAPSATTDGSQAVSEPFVVRPFTSWLQYRIQFAADRDSPIVDEVAVSYVSSTAGPALVDLVGREPLPGPPTQTPPPQAIARGEWGNQAAPLVLERQTPVRVELDQLRASVDDPNSAATLRALRWIANNRYGQADLPFHYVLNGTGTVFAIQSSATVRLANTPAGTVRIGLLADAEREGVSEATQAALTSLLAWLGEAYGLPTNALAADATAPSPLRDLVPELGVNADRAVVRWRRFFPEGSPSNGPERLVLFNPNPTEARATLIGYTATTQERRSLIVPPNQRVDVTLNTAFPDIGSLGLGVLADRTLLAERIQISGRELLGSGGASDPRRTWYFATADTRSATQSYLLVINPQNSPVEALLTLYPDGVVPLTRTVTFAPQARSTVLLNDLLPDQRFGLKLVALQPIVAERSIFASNGAGSLATGSAQLSRRWLFAEGATTTGYSTTLHLLNPWPQQVSVTVQVLSEDGTTVSRRYAVPGTTRLSVALNEVAPDLPFALDIQADRPLAAEREVIFGDGQGMTLSEGTSAPATRWSFAEGSTSPPAEQFLLIANPNRAAVTLEVVYTLANGQTERRSHTMPPTSRLSIAANIDVPDQAVLSATVIANRPVVAERSIYVRGAEGIGGETSLGVPSE